MRSRRFRNPSWKPRQPAKAYAGFIQRRTATPRGASATAGAPLGVPAGPFPPWNGGLSCSIGTSGSFVHLTGFAEILCADNGLIPGQTRFGPVICTKVLRGKVLGPLAARRIRSESKCPRYLHERFAAEDFGTVMHEGREPGSPELHSQTAARSQRSTSSRESRLAGVPPRRFAV